jgi:SAM-dependent methyltransferase
MAPYPPEVISAGRYNREQKQLLAQEAFGFCQVCGTFGEDDRQAMSSRESMNCGFCGSSYRLRQLSRALSLVINQENHGLVPLVDLVKQPAFKELRIAEINSSGMLHSYLAKLPRLEYSEYGSKDPKVPSQDLQKLTYKNEQFDLVITSDTLEHVPDFKQALKETQRVLKPGGWHIFTIPVVWGRPTVTRTKKQAGQPSYLKTKSYHGSGEADYLVWTEFGDDVVKSIVDQGFEVSVFFLNTQNLHDTSAVFVCQKKGGQQRQFPKIDSLFVGNDPRAKELATLWDPSRQADRDRQLRQKIKLTVNHASNLQVKLDQTTRQKQRLTKQVGELEDRLQGIYSSRTWKAARGVARVGRKLKPKG